MLWPSQGALAWRSWAARLVLAAVLVGLGLLGLVQATPPVDDAYAAQSCTDLGFGQQLCLTNVQALNPIQVGQTQTYTVTLSVQPGPINYIDGTTLTTVVPAIFCATASASPFFCRFSA